MRSSDWSSDVCCSDLNLTRAARLRLCHRRLGFEANGRKKKATVPPVSIAKRPAIRDKCGTALSDSAQLQLQADHGIDIEAGDVRDLVERQRRDRKSVV